MRSWKRISAYLGIIGGLIFVIVTFIAMLTFPGGYNFLENYFSHLGLHSVIRAVTSFEALRHLQLYQYFTLT